MQSVGEFLAYSINLEREAADRFGQLADATSIEFVYKVCAFLPAIGLLTALLPNLERPRARL